AIGLSLGFVISFASCGTPKAKCSPATCGGCCDVMDLCQSGTTATVCGVAGNTCNSCVAGQVCQSGMCKGGGTGGGSGTGGGHGGGSGGGSGGGTATGGGAATGGGSGGGGA